MRKTLLLASEVRSGSTYIAESIAYHFEKKAEYYFHGTSQEKFSHLVDCATATDIMEIYNTLYLDKSGWASSKIMCAALSIITRESRRSNEVHSAFFGDATFWIIVRRRDRVKQAVSLALARKSGLYHYYENATESPDVNYQLDIQEIRDALSAIELSDTYLNTFKQSLTEGQYVEIFYEDFLKNEVKFINQVGDLTGITNIADPDTYVSLAKLRPTATQLKSDYAESFKYWLLENYHPTKT
jgi:LPS sulfotransferase NodH